MDCGQTGGVGPSVSYHRIGGLLPEIRSPFGVDDHENFPYPIDLVSYI